MLSPQQIQYILTLAEMRNFSRAAEVCFVTQPTLSMQVKKAEETIGFPIFDRNRNPLELTRLGRELLPLLREIEADFRHIANLSKRAKGDFLEEVRIGIIPTVSAYLIPELYARWKAEMPHTQLVIEEKKSEEILDNLLSKKIDLGIMAGPVMEPGVQVEPLFTEEIKVYLPDYPDAEVPLQVLEDLQPWLLSKGNCLRTQMMNFCELPDDDQLHSWNYEGGNIEMLLRMVDLHGGYTLVPDYYKQILDAPRKNFRRIQGKDHQQIPARAIVGLMQHKHTKRSAIEPLIRSIKLNFVKKSNDFSVLNWK
jgi:LysR family hydrogen peroxide-inducible transcriptional activator